MMKSTNRSSLHLVFFGWCVALYSNTFTRKNFCGVFIVQSIYSDLYAMHTMLWNILLEFTKRFNVCDFMHIVYRMSAFDWLQFPINRCEKSFFSYQTCSWNIFSSQRIRTICFNSQVFHISHSNISYSTIEETSWQETKLNV